MTSDRDEIEKVTFELDRLAGSWTIVHPRYLARQAAALIRRLVKERDEARIKINELYSERDAAIAERDEAIKASINASLLVNRKARDEIEELKETVKRLQKERDELFAFDVTIRNKALNEAADYIRENCWCEPEKHAKAILALKSKEPT